MHTCRCIHLCQHFFKPSHVHQCILLGHCTRFHFAVCVGAPALVHALSQCWQHVQSMVLILLSSCTCIPRVCCRSTVLYSSIVSGLFPPFPNPYPPLFPMYIIYQCDGCPSSLMHRDSWLGCQDLPSMGAVSSRSWLPIE